MWDEATRHLLSQGWVEGTFSVYDAVQEPGVIAPPNDRVETFVREMVQSSSFSKEDVTWKSIWRSPHYTEEQLQALRERYPKPGF